MERKLAIELGASLTAVREGLIELELEGFIIKKRNSGTHVTKLAPVDVEKIFELRAVLECYAFGEAARNATPEDIDSLERRYLEMVDAARNKDAIAYNHKDVAWHSLVWQMTKNDFLQAALKRAILPYFASMAIRVNSVDPFVLLHDATGHYPLVEAIKARDPEAAERSYAARISEWLLLTREELSHEHVSEQLVG